LKWKNGADTQNIMLYELHQLFKLIWHKKKMLWLQTMKIFFAVHCLQHISSLSFCHFLLS